MEGVAGGIHAHLRLLYAMRLWCVYLHSACYTFYIHISGIQVTHDHLGLENADKTSVWEAPLTSVRRDLFDL